MYLGTEFYPWIVNMYQVPVSWHVVPSGQLTESRHLY